MMSDEEKEAIKFLKALKDLQIVLTCSFWNKGEFKFNTLQKEQFDIILNLISKLQKENTKLKNFNSYLSNSDIDYLERENIKLQKELDKKDKVINLMTKAIFYEDNSNSELRKLSTCEIIKEYFYKKAEGEENE